MGYKFCEFLGVATSFASAAAKTAVGTHGKVGASAAFSLAARYAMRLILQPKADRNAGNFGFRNLNRAHAPDGSHCVTTVFGDYGTAIFGNIFQYQNRLPAQWEPSCSQTRMSY